MCLLCKVVDERKGLQDRRSSHFLCFRDSDSEKETGFRGKAVGCNAQNVEVLFGS